MLKSFKPYTGDGALDDETVQDGTKRSKGWDERAHKQMVTLMRQIRKYERHGWYCKYEVTYRELEKLKPTKKKQTVLAANESILDDDDLADLTQWEAV